MSNVKDFSMQLAQEIQSRGMFELEELSVLIRTRMKQSIIDILSEYVSHDEAEYARLLQIYYTKVGTSEYLSYGLKLSALRAKIKLANKALTQERISVKKNDQKVGYCMGEFTDVKTRGLSVNASVKLSNGVTTNTVFMVVSENDIPLVGDSIEMKLTTSGWVVVPQTWMK